MAENGIPKLTPGQRKAIEHLLAERNVREAAAAGMGERTLHRYLTEPHFRQALTAAEGDLIDGATRRLLSLHGQAIDTFSDLLKAESTSDTVKLRAAQAVLDNILKLRELRNVEARLEALELAYLVDNQ